MTRKDDQEERILDTYRLIQEWKDTERLSSDPTERERAQRNIKMQQGYLKEYLNQYVRLCHVRELRMEDDIVDIALIAGVDLEPEEKPAAPTVVPAPPPPPTPTIPITIAEWQHTLTHERNEVFGKPAGYWCYVRGGTYHIGGWEADEPSADITLRPFWVARFPVINEQYAEAAGGYQTERWWTPNGWQWQQKEQRTQPGYWDDVGFSGSNQPVISVTWYEAVAFARWLTAQLQAVLPDGYVIRLPTEAEWEAAAAYDAAMQRHTYPWGEDAPTPERAIYITDEQGRKRERPARVGLCPAGAAACGALDMAGTVSEWTVSSYKAYPAQSGPQHIAKDFIPGDRDIPLRSGSWGSDRTNVCCGARYREHPCYGYLSYGFRVFAAPQVE